MVRVLEDSYEPVEVAMDIKDRARDGAQWRDFAILYRTNKQHGLFEAALTRRGIPYRVYKGMSLLEHKDVRNMLAYLSLIINPNDDEAFKRIVNYPARGIGDTTVARIEEIARAKNLSMWHAVSELVAATVHDSVEKVVVRKVSDFVRLISELSAMRTQMSVCDFGKEVLARTGILHMLEAEKKPENDTSKDYLDQLLSMMSSYEEECAKDVDEGLRDAEFEPTVDEWMQNIMLQTDQDQSDDDNRVTLMTVHSAKGLEYDYVYIVGMEEGLFPSSRSVESLSDLEEERRLMYVAVTRAKRAVMLSYAEMRRVWGKTENTTPSRFLKEIESQYVDANFELDELSGRSRWERAMGDVERAAETPRQRYDVRRGEVPVRRFCSTSNEPQRPRPEIIATPKPLDPTRAGMRSVGVRAADTSAAVGDCQYAVGDRVAHPKFGAGRIERIEPLSTDHKLVVEFDSYGSKTLLAKFAKLTKL
jgi:DNA helicase-2/ATP-dependent DNA helicase PcrA